MNTSGSPESARTGQAGSLSHTGCPPNFDTGSVTGSAASRKRIRIRGRNSAS
jgi:hypothetical protein